MIKLPRKGLLLALLTLIWCIFNEQFNIKTILIGFIVALVTTFILKYLVLIEGENYDYSMSVIRFIHFFIVLIKNIYISAFVTIKHIIKNDINPQFVATETDLKRPWLQAIVANAVTLTPGTVTVHLADGNFTILWIYPKTVRYKDIKKYLIQEFEDVLIKEDYHD